MEDQADKETQDAWKGILFAHARVVQALEADLLASADLPLTWLDVMNRLREHPDRRLRVHELAERPCSHAAGSRGLSIASRTPDTSSGNTPVTTGEASMSP